MRRENDYIAIDRKSFLYEIIVNCPSSSVLEIEGNLPKNIFQGYSLKPSNHFIITTNNREVLADFLQTEDEEIAKNSAGAIFKSGDSIWFESYHLYDYGTSNKSGQIIFIHDAFSDQLLDKLINAKVLIKEQSAT